VEGGLTGGRERGRRGEIRGVRGEKGVKIGGKRIKERGGDGKGT